MRILMVSDWETQYGGAAIAASRLANAICAAGHSVSRLVSSRDNNPEHPWKTFELTLSKFGWGIKRVFPDAFGQHYSESELKNKLRRRLDKLHPDIINIHNIHGALAIGWTLEWVQICAEYAPLVWTLHDMWSFTGRCAYSYTCQQFLDGCTASCPTHDQYPSLSPERISQAWCDRREIIGMIGKLIAVTPSSWLAEQAISGLWPDQHVKVIPNGLPLDIIKPYPTQAARRTLGIPEDGAPVLLFSAADLAEPRKGGRILEKSLELLDDVSLTLLTFGENEIARLSNAHTHVSLGYISEDHIKALAYSAADIYVHPALADNLPNTVMEAIACGTPGIGFDVGGVGELVRPHQSGWLAISVSADGFADAIRTALRELDSFTSMPQTCRDIAVTEYSDDLQAERYLHLFRTLL